MDRVPEMQRQKVSKMSRNELECRNETQLESQFESAGRPVGTSNTVRGLALPRNCKNGPRGSLGYLSAPRSDNDALRRRMSMPSLLTEKIGEQTSTNTNSNGRNNDDVSARRSENLSLEVQLDMDVGACQSLSSFAPEDSEFDEGSRCKVRKSAFPEIPASV